MRICLVSNEFAPFHGSGVGVYAAEAARAWAAAGHEVHVVTGDHAGVAEGGPRVCPGVVFHPVDLQDGMAANLPEPKGAVQWPLGAFERVAWLHARGGFDYIEFPDLHGEGYFAVQSRRLEGGLAGAVIGVRLHMPCCLIDEKNGRTWRGRLRAYLEEMERRAIEGADVVWAPCRAVAEEMRRIGLRIGEGGRRVVVSPNPMGWAEAASDVDVASGLIGTDSLRGLRESVAQSGASDSGASARSTAPSVELAEPRSTPPPHAGEGDLRTRSDSEAGSAGECGQSVVFVGRLERRKGVEVLVRAGVELCRERAGVVVRVIGGDTDTGPLDGSVVAWLEAMIPADVRERVRLEGQVPRERAIAAMDEATVVCFPALWDNWPYAVLEAMAAGRCIVATRAGGQAEMLEDGATAVMCEAGDVEGLGAALRRALDDEGLRGRLGAAARERAREWCDAAKFVDETTRVIAESRETALAHARGSDGRGTTDVSDVTVVIPHKDMGDLLVETLESLAGQTARGFRTIVVDDGSTNPRTLALLERLEREGFGAVGFPEWLSGTGGGTPSVKLAEPRLTPLPHAGERVRGDLALSVIRPGSEGLRRSGPAAARNTGIAAAGTAYIVTLDADDLLAPEHIQRCRGVLERDATVACVGALVSYFDEHPSRPTGSWAPLGLVRDMLPAMNTLGTGSGIMFRREALAGLRGASVAGPYDPTMPGYEDWEMYCALAAAGHRAEIVPDFLVHYRVREDSRYHGQDRLKHERLVAEIAARHPGLAETADVAMRLALAEARARQQPERARLKKLRRERDGLRKKLRRADGRVAEMREAVLELRARLRRMARARGGVGGEAVGEGMGTGVDGGGVGGARPLRYRAADRAAAMLGRAGLGGVARRVANRLRRDRR